MGSFVKNSAAPPKMRSKVLSLTALAECVREQKAQGRRVVHCHGTFDLMHPGHIRYFEAAAREGDVLVVTVTADQFVKKGIGRPVFREQLRAESIASLACVDYVAIDPHETSEEAIILLRPHVYAKGSDYEGKEQEPGHPTAVERVLVEQYGGRMHFTHDPVTFSSTALINDHLSPLPESVCAVLREIRAHYSESDFVDVFQKMRNLRVLVIGDAILDVYHYSHFLGRSVKEEIPRVRVLGSEMFLGGSLAVANMLAGVCDRVGLVSVLGMQQASQEEQHERFIHEHLKKNVTPELFHREDAPTVINERFVNNEPYLVDAATKVKLRKYFGLYRMNEAPLPQQLEEELNQHIQHIAREYDVVLVTDYGLGMLTEKLVDTLARLSQFLAVNTQTNSMNFGFNLITKYAKANYVSISLPEMQLALHDKHSDPEHLAATISRVMHVDTVAVTLGALGVLLRDATGSTSIPALTTNVIDNIGAGDAFLALSSLGVHLHLPRALSGFLGAAAAAQSCGIIANKTTVDRAMLLRTIQALLKSSK